jgi:hypothetical protein
MIDSPGLPRLRAGQKKDRIVRTTRSKSREETPKEGNDRKTCRISNSMLRCTNVKPFLRLHSKRAFTLAIIVAILPHFPNGAR